MKDINNGIYNLKVTNFSIFISVLLLGIAGCQMFFPVDMQFERKNIVNEAERDAYFDAGVRVFSRWGCVITVSNKPAILNTEFCTLGDYKLYGPIAVRYQVSTTPDSAVFQTFPGDCFPSGCKPSNQPGMWEGEAKNAAKLLEERKLEWLREVDIVKRERKIKS